ncbi:ankyrin repeat domain-containing protein [Parashewanella tropica]|uniref:ankyrin repeat domain-containing protein n=1 Tax=Parashewanella tropica TaxID=2547970 RepID=UPI001059AA29|nr:ankyrin repeat domain-containing protein [Parashewanella tropica]
MAATTYQPPQLSPVAELNYLSTQGGQGTRTLTQLAASANTNQITEINGLRFTISPTYSGKLNACFCSFHDQSQVSSPQPNSVLQKAKLWVAQRMPACLLASIFSTSKRPQIVQAAIEVKMIEQRLNANRQLLFEVCKNGEIEKLNALIQHGINLNTRDSNGFSPLYYATMKCHLSTIEVLVNNGARIVTHEEKSTLHSRLSFSCSRFGHQRQINAIALSGIDLNKRFDFERTALMRASSNGNIEAVRTLLKHSSNIDSADCVGSTALHLAADHGHSAVVALLIKSGATPTLCDFNGLTPLQIACTSGHLQVVETLLEHETENIDWQDSLGYTPLMHATRTGNPSIVKALLKHTKNVNLSTHHGKTALHIAIFQGSTEVIELLKSAGAEVNAKTEVGKTPLHFAARDHQFTTAKALLENANANADIQDSHGETPLMIVAKDGDIELAKLLISHTTDINLVNHSGQSALYLAVMNGHSDIVDCLLKNGASAELRNIKSETPLKVATRCRQYQAVKVLLDHDPDIVNASDSQGWTALMNAASYGDIDTVKLLLKHQVDVNVVNHDGKTALYCAADGGHSDVVSLLLEHGASAIQRDKQAFTPLQIAAHKGRGAVVDVLLKQPEVDIDAQNDRGWTALMLAAAHGNVGIVRSLLSHTINIQATHHNGETALEIALHNSRLGDKGCKKVVGLIKAKMKEQTST